MSEPSKATPSAAVTDQQTEVAVLAGGCFWGVEDVFAQIPGVMDAVSGYQGGLVERPTYKQVCTSDTGHAESVKVVFDPSRVTYKELLDVFFKNHDPTTLNRQGPDVGSQYRSAIFYHSDAQKAAAEAARERWGASGRFRRPIVTEISPAQAFWRAEEYHQRYLEKRGLASCHVP